MKTLVFGIRKWLVAFSLLVPSTLVGLPLGNPAESSLFSEGVFFHPDCTNGYLQWFSLRGGYYGDCVFNRRLRVDGQGNGFKQNISSVRMITNAGYLALNICKMVDIFSTLGTTRLKIETNGLTWSPLSNFHTIAYSREDFSWGLGARAAIYNCRGFRFGLEGQYFAAYCPIDSFIEWDTSRPIYPKNHSFYREWQVGLGLTYEATICSPIAILPYTGLKWARARYITDNFQAFTTDGILETFYNLKSKFHWGIPLGVTVLFCKAFSLEVETRWLDERALTAKAQMQF